MATKVFFYTLRPYDELGIAQRLAPKMGIEFGYTQEHAMLLLSDPDIPVTEAALQSGFSSLSTFLRVFRSVKQCTPTEFRDMYIHPEKLQKNP